MEAAGTKYHDGILTVTPVLVLMVLVLLLGVYIPPPFRTLIEDAARFLGSRP